MSTKLCVSCVNNLGYCDYNQHGFPNLIKCTGYIEEGKSNVIVLPNPQVKSKEKKPEEFYLYSKDKEKKCLYYAKLPN